MFPCTQCQKSMRASTSTRTKWTHPTSRGGGGVAQFTNKGGKSQSPNGEFTGVRRKQRDELLLDVLVLVISSNETTVVLLERTMKFVEEVHLDCPDVQSAKIGFNPGLRTVSLVIFTIGASDYSFYTAVCTGLRASPGARLVFKTGVCSGRTPGVAVASAGVSGWVGQQRLLRGQPDLEIPRGFSGPHPGQGGRRLPQTGWKRDEDRRQASGRGRQRQG